MSLQAVGINNFTCPAHIREKNGGLQQTVASVDLLAYAPQSLMASCVPTMTALLTRHLPDVHAALFPPLLAEMRSALQAAETRIRMSFPYFIDKKAPVSGTASLMEYHCSFAASSEDQDEPMLTVVVPVTTVCPCSKEISDFGAHNQRAEVTLTVQPLALIWLEDLIAMVEACGSSQVYALLKRPDEKYLTEYAYSHPMFVEDVARKAAQEASKHADISWFSVSVESFESIHKHNAYALVDSHDLNLGDDQQDLQKNSLGRFSPEPTLPGRDI